jgi:cysteine-rich repeat protein
MLALSAMHRVILAHAVTGRLLAGLLGSILLARSPMLAHAYCGDLTRDGVEQCDGADLDEFTCADFCGSGTLRCKADCTFDLRSCTVCGNGVIDSGETCDGTALGGASCPQGGALACLADCSGYDDADCYACGNGRREGSEACDGSDVGNATCSTPTYHGGTPGCTGGCTLDYGPAYCWRCGDGVLQGDEECDAGSGNGSPGNNCTASCALRCGDNVVQQGEQCDDGNQSDGDGCSGCYWESTEWIYAGGTVGDSCPAATPACLDACYAVWNTAAVQPAATVRCADGASCDRDGARNGQCRIRYFFCLNEAQNAAPGSPPPSCFPRDVKRLALRFPATTLAAADQSVFLDAAQEVLGRFNGAVTRDATSITRSTGLNRGGVCGGAELTVPTSAPRVLSVDTTDSGNPTNSATNQKTDVDAITFECTS